MAPGAHFSQGTNPLPLKAKLHATGRPIQNWQKGQTQLPNCVHGWTTDNHLSERNAFEIHLSATLWKNPTGIQRSIHMLRASFVFPWTLSSLGQDWAMRLQASKLLLLWSGVRALSSVVSPQGLFVLQDTPCSGKCVSIHSQENEYSWLNVYL